MASEDSATTAKYIGEMLTGTVETGNTSSGNSMN